MLRAMPLPLLLVTGVAATWLVGPALLGLHAGTTEGDCLRTSLEGILTATDLTAKSSEVTAASDEADKHDADDNGSDLLTHAHETQGNAEGPEKLGWFNKAGAKWGFWTQQKFIIAKAVDMNATMNFDCPSGSHAIPDSPEGCKVAAEYMGLEFPQDQTDKGKEYLQSLKEGMGVCFFTSMPDGQVFKGEASFRKNSGAGTVCQCKDGYKAVGCAASEPPTTCEKEAEAKHWCLTTTCYASGYPEPSVTQPTEMVTVSAKMSREWDNNLKFNDNVAVQLYLPRYDANQALDGPCPMNSGTMNVVKRAGERRR